ncbi:hypothetical protein ACFWXA_13005 [Streptomyces atroolivaceus]|uniref:hypothetical protein n=1 Tax=Streptomyces atroolivaceus TaxID=66869 RepID=UPI003658667A
MTAPKNPPVYNDHETTAEHARACPGEWVWGGNYQTANGANATARQVRRGAKPAYEPAGAYQAVVKNDAGHTLYVRYATEAQKTARVDVSDCRPVGQVAASRRCRSEQPEKFQACMALALTAVKGGADLATSVWTAVDPVKTAAEIEALAGLRRLSACAKDTK